MFNAESRIVLSNEGAVVVVVGKLPGGYSLIWPIRGCAAGQGMVFVLSVLNSVHDCASLF